MLLAAKVQMLPLPSFVKLAALMMFAFGLMFANFTPEVPKAALAASFVSNSRQALTAGFRAFYVARTSRLRNSVRLGELRADGEAMKQNHSLLLGVGIGLFCTLAILTARYVAGVLAG
jgi:hypothetical protein